MDNAGGAGERRRVSDTDARESRAGRRRRLRLGAVEARLPFVDWRRTLTSSVALGVPVGIGAYLIAQQVDPGLWPLFWSVVTLVALLALGYRLGRSSPTRSYLGPAIMGVLVGLGTEVGISVGGSFEPVELAALALFGALFSTAGGAIAYRESRPGTGLGYTCPHCHQQSRYSGLGYATVPLWTRCGHCGTTLFGDRPIQMLTLAHVLVAVAVVLTVFAIIPFLLQFSVGSPLATGDFVPPSYVIPVAPLLAGGVALFLVVWVIGLSPRYFLAVRYGTYIEEDPSRSLRLVRWYLTAGGAGSIALVAAATLYGGLSPLTGAVLVPIAFAPLLLLYSRYGLRLRDPWGKAAAFALLVWASIIGVSAVVYGVYFVVNLPKEGPLEGRSTLTFGSSSARDSWDQATSLLREFERTGEDADEVLDFLGQNALSPPEDFQVDTEIPRLFLLQSLAGSEMSEIRQSSEWDPEAEAYERYLRLWSIANNLIPEHAQTLIQYLVGVRVASQLVDLYIDMANENGPAVDQRLVSAVANLHSKLDDGLANAILTEESWVGSALISNPDHACRLYRELEGQSAALCILELPWPFFDKNRTLRLSHERSTGLAELSQGAFYRIEGDLDDSMSEQSARVSRLVNPVGSLVLWPPPTSVFAGFIRAKELTKARLTLLRHVLESQDKGDLKDTPIDPLTGKPFAVIDLGDSIEISSTYTVDGAPALRYELETD